MLDLPIISPGTQMHACASLCGGACCNYFSLQLDTPRTATDFDAVRWYLMHEDTHVYRYQNAWYLMILRRCRNLLPNNLCGIYETRPEICRDYDATSCEFTGPVPYQLYFRNEQDFEVWLRERQAARRTAAKSARVRRAERSGKPARKGAPKVARARAPKVARKRGLKTAPRGGGKTKARV